MTSWFLVRACAPSDVTAHLPAVPGRWSDESWPFSRRQSCVAAKAANAVLHKRQKKQEIRRKRILRKKILAKKKKKRAPDEARQEQLLRLAQRRGAKPKMKAEIRKEDGQEEEVKEELGNLEPGAGEEPC